MLPQLDASFELENTVGGPKHMLTHTTDEEGDANKTPSVAESGPLETQLPNTQPEDPGQEPAAGSEDAHHDRCRDELE